MYTITGSGFGLYGYLPAIVEGLGQRVVLPIVYQKTILSRPDIAHLIHAIEWVEDEEIAFSKANHIVIAKPPFIQERLLSNILERQNIKTLILEKPLATNPGNAEILLKLLRNSKKKYRIAYTFLYTKWANNITPIKNNNSSFDIYWTFMANHFSQNLPTWKRNHLQGGGALRFYGIHLVALLVYNGYSSVHSSTLEGEKATEPERWTAEFLGQGLPNCRVVVDSRNSASLFKIAYHYINGIETTLLEIQDPFQLEPDKELQDRRISMLQHFLSTLPEESNKAWEDYYCRVGLLWKEVENKLNYKTSTPI